VWRVKVLVGTSGNSLALATYCLCSAHAWRVAANTFTPHATRNASRSAAQVETTLSSFLRLHKRDFRDSLAAIVILHIGRRSVQPFLNILFVSHSLCLSVTRADCVQKRLNVSINQSINQSIISLLTHDKTHMLTPGNTQLQHRKVSTSL